MHVPTQRGRALLKDCVSLSCGLISRLSLAPRLGNGYGYCCGKSNGYGFGHKLTAQTKVAMVMNGWLWLTANAVALAMAMAMVMAMAMAMAMAQVGVACVAASQPDRVRKWRELARVGWRDSDRPDRVWNW